MNSANQHIVWYRFKCDFRGHAIKYASFRHKQRIAREKMPLENIENMQSHLDNSDKSSGLGDLVLLDWEQKMRERIRQHEVSGVI